MGIGQSNSFCCIFWYCLLSLKILSVYFCAVFFFSMLHDVTRNVKLSQVELNCSMTTVGWWWFQICFIFTPIWLYKRSYGPLINGLINRWMVLLYFTPLMGALTPLFWGRFSIFQMGWFKNQQDNCWTWDDRWWQSPFVGCLVFLARKNPRLYDCVTLRLSWAILHHGLQQVLSRKLSTLG